MTRVNLPIGVFDSGMGGLTVLRALKEALPGEQFIYLGDTARLPYGTKSPRTVTRYALKASELLVARGVKALVVACNTAAGIALPSLQKRYADLPVYGVVMPGAAASAAVADHTGVLVLGTESTIGGGAYQRELLNLNPDLRIYGRSCPLWVTLAEQGPVSERLLQAVLEEYLAVDDCPGTVLLGCTHFPVFAQRIEALLGPGHHVVDSARTTAEVVSAELERRSELNPGDPGIQMLATDGVARFQKVGGYFLGEPVGPVELVDL